MAVIKPMTCCIRLAKKRRVSSISLGSTTSVRLSRTALTSPANRASCPCRNSCSLVATSLGSGASCSDRKLSTRSMVLPESPEPSSSNTCFSSAEYLSIHLPVEAYTMGKYLVLLHGGAVSTERFLIKKHSTLTSISRMASDLWSTPPPGVRVPGRYWFPFLGDIKSCAAELCRIDKGEKRFLASQDLAYVCELLNRGRQ